MGYEPIMHNLTNQITTVPEVTKRLEELEQQQEEAKAAIERAAWQMTRNRSTWWKPFKKGDLVWLDMCNIEDPTLPPKLKPRRYGPFEVETVHSKLVYRLKIPMHWKVHPVFHADLLTPYHTNQWYGKAKATPKPTMIKGHKEYEVDKILDHQKQRDIMEYLVA